MTLILWIDFETTDLDKQECELLEVAAVVTDDKLEVDRAVFQSLIRPSAGHPYTRRMPEVVANMHTSNGLIKEIDAGIDNDTLPSVAAVEQSLIAFIDAWVDEIGGQGTDGSKVALGGSGTSHFDAQVIEYRMPSLYERITYWSYDVGVMRRFFRDFTELGAIGLIHTPDSKNIDHRAFTDVLAHLDEVRHYQRVMRMLMPPIPPQ